MTTINGTQLRQDGDGDVDEAIAGFETVAGPIGQIITGTLSGNIGQLFNGITGTVTDEAAQPGVGSILTGVSLPLSHLWQSGIAAGTKYFNITTESPLKNNATQTQLNSAGLPNTPGNQNQQVVQLQNVGTAGAVGQAQLQQQVIPNQAVVAAVPPPPAQPVETTTQLSEDDDDEDENDLNRNNAKL